MFVFFFFVLNFMYVLFYFVVFSVGFSVGICSGYLVVCWLLVFSTFLFSDFSFDYVVHLSLDFFCTIVVDSLSIMFMFLVLVVFSSWLFYIVYYGTGFYYYMHSCLVFYSLLHFSVSILFLGNVGLFVILLEFLSIPVYFLFTTTSSSDWFIGLSFLLFYSSLTGMFLLLSLSFVLYFDWFFTYDLSFVYSAFFIFISFLINSSFFPFHSWLPYVHGLCSTVGSVFLAGVFLNLGSLGLLRLFICLSAFSYFFYYQFVFVFFSLVGSVFSLFCSFVQIDFKNFIAFSSVSHMNFSVLVLFLGGVLPSVLIWLSHGFVTSLLFYSFGYYYSSFGSRLSVLFGNSVFSSLWYFHFVFLLLLDVGLPPFLSFYAEFLSFEYILDWSVSLFCLCLVSFLFLVFVTLSAMFSFSCGFSSFVVIDYTLPIFYMFMSFTSLYGLFSWLFLVDIYI